MVPCSIMWLEVSLSFATDRKEHAMLEQAKMRGVPCSFD
jgi:hypothetical protein